MERSAAHAILAAMPGWPCLTIGSPQ